MNIFEALNKRKLQLSFCQNILNMRDYAAAWLRLARRFRDIDFASNAQYCLSRGKYYAQIAKHGNGEYVRLFDGSFAELIYAGEVVPYVERER